MLRSLAQIWGSNKRLSLPSSKLNLVLIQEDVSLSPKQIRRLKTDLQSIIQRHLTEQETQLRAQEAFDSIKGGAIIPNETLTITVSL